MAAPFDDSHYQKFSAAELIADMRRDNRIMWGRHVCVSGWLHVMRNVSFMSETDDSGDLVLFPGPLLNDALRQLRCWALYGGSVSYEGPATVWCRGVQHSSIPHIGGVGLSPSRLKFACRPGSDGQPHEPVEIELPQPTNSHLLIEMLGGNEFVEFVRLPDHFRTSVLLHRTDLLADRFDEAEQLFQLANFLRNMDQENPVLQDLTRWAASLRDTFQQILRDYEQCSAKQGFPLAYSPAIGERVFESQRPIDQQCPISEFVADKPDEMSK